MFKLVCICMLACMIPLCAPGKSIGEALEKMSPAHPRLFTGNGGLERLKANAATPDGRALAGRVLHDAEVLLDVSPMTRRMSGKRLLMTCRRILFRVNTLGVAWLLTGEKRFAERGIREMEAAAKFKDWNPSHFLDVGELTLALAIGYDWFYSRMSEEQRKMIREAIVEKGLKPSLADGQWWISASNNWAQVCHAGMTAGALAVREEEPELAEQVITRAVANLPKCMKASYDPFGAYPEGPMYWTYGTEFNAALLALLESAAGDDFGLAGQPGFDRTLEYIVAMTAPSGLPFSYADTNMAPIDYGFGQAWLIDRFDRKDCFTRNSRASFDRLAALRRADPFRNDDRLLPLALFYLAGGYPEQGAADQPLSYFSGPVSIPVSVHRSGADSRAVYLGMKAGFPAGPHGHMDGGSFVIEADGVRWAEDLGMEDYGRMEKRPVKLWDTRQGADRWRKIFRLGYKSHNILLIDGEEQRVHGKSRITEFRGAGEGQTTVIDLTPLYAGQLKRGTRTGQLLPDRRIVIADELAGVAPGAVVRWQMCTGAGVDGISGQALALKRGKESMTLSAEAPSPVVWRVTEAKELMEPHDSPNPDTRMVWFETAAPADGRVAIRVVFTPGSGR